MNEVTIEIILANKSSAKSEDIINICTTYLENYENSIKPGIISQFPKDFGLLREEVKHIIIEANNGITSVINLSEMELRWFVYKLDEHGVQMEYLDDDTNGEVNLAAYWTLPSADIFSVWENLIYDSDIKEQLINYAATMVLFSGKGVNTNVVSCNRVILLHGPPGSGKTSLCRALAQKLSVRLQKHYSKSVLVEINSHSLFSKWFSESGKLVTKMFSKIHEIVEDRSMLVCVLIDEIESLVHARDQSLSGNEPSDAMRVVNAVLTQIDQIKRYPNVLILTTSNITEAIDVAFVDRADIKQYIGPPSAQAISKIYLSCIEELIQTELITTSICELEIEENRAKILSLSEKSVSLNGRTLRKLPMLAFATFLVKSNKKVTLNVFLSAMEQAIVKELNQREYFKKKPKNCGDF